MLKTLQRTVNTCQMFIVVTIIIITIIDNIEKQYPDLVGTKLCFIIGLLFDQLIQSQSLSV